MKSFAVLSFLGPINVLSL